MVNYNIIDLSHLTKGFDMEQSIALHDMLSMSYTEMLILLATAIKSI